MGSEELLPEEIVHRALNRFRGKCCGFVEACNLPERQERGIVSTLKSLSYDVEKEIIEEVLEQ